MPEDRALKIESFSEAKIQDEKTEYEDEAMGQPIRATVLYLFNKTSMMD